MKVKVQEGSGAQLSREKGENATVAIVFLKMFCDLMTQR